jgi:hypothetical protein
MINLYNQVPSVYPSASRDFQYLSWLFNIVLNSVKHNVDSIYNLPNVDSDTKLAELLAMTLGFKIKRNYDQKQLVALTAILHAALKYKGTEKAILMAAEALVKATGSLGDAYVEINGTEVEVTLPKDLTDITLFLDLLDYILPAGMTCRIIRKNKKSKKVDDLQVRFSDKLNVLVADDLGWAGTIGDEESVSEGLSGLYRIPNGTALQRGETKQTIEEAIISSNSILSTANILDTGALNAGLLDNTVIPVLKDSRAIKVDDTVYLYGYTSDADTTPIPLHDTNGVALKAKSNIKQEL